MLDLPPVTTDPAIMRLAHPLRFIATQPTLFEQMKQVLGPRTMRALQEAFGDDEALTGVAVDRLTRMPEHSVLRDCIDVLNLAPSGTEMGNSFAFLVALRQHIKPAPYFRLDDELARLLEHTDIAEDIPAGCLRPPYPRVYIEFGTARDLAVRLPNVQSGLHVLEGAYVETGWHPVAGRSLYAMLTGSPLGKENALDDATHAVLLPLDDGQRPLLGALQWSFERSLEMARGSGLRQSPQEFLEVSLTCLQYLAKALLYIGLPEARRAAHPERSEFLRQHNGLKSAAKRAKAERRARLLVDHIVISAPPVAAPMDTRMETGRGVRAHWRRGHYRMQPYGPQRQQRRLTWIRPTLVHGESAEPVPAPAYEVR